MHFSIWYIRLKPSGGGAEGDAVDDDVTEEVPGEHLRDDVERDEVGLEGLDLTRSALLGVLVAPDREVRLELLTRIVGLRGAEGLTVGLDDAATRGVAVGEDGALAVRGDGSADDLEVLGAEALRDPEDLTDEASGDEELLQALLPLRGETAEHRRLPVVVDLVRGVHGVDPILDLLEGVDDLIEGDERERGALHAGVLGRRLAAVSLLAIGRHDGYLLKYPIRRVGVDPTDGGRGTVLVLTSDPS